MASPARPWLRAALPFGVVMSLAACGGSGTAAATPAAPAPSPTRSAPADPRFAALTADGICELLSRLVPELDSMDRGAGILTVRQQLTAYYSARTRSPSAPTDIGDDADEKAGRRCPYLLRRTLTSLQQESLTDVLRPD